MKLNRITAATLLALVLPFAVAAGDTNSAPASAKGERTLDALTVASQLARIGVAEKDPLLLVAAAKIKKLTPTTDVKLDKKTEGTATSDAASDGETLTVDALLAKASELSGDNAAYQALIAEVGALKSRGAVGGAKSHWDRVKAGQTDVYTIEFRGDREAEVGIEGDGDTDLDLYIHDENGNLICSDTDGTDVMYCSWTPMWSGSFKVSIKNLGSVYNEYLLMTN